MCVEFSDVLVGAQVHLEIQHGLVRVGLRVRPFGNQVLVLGAVAGVVEVKHARSQVALP